MQTCVSACVNMHVSACALGGGHRYQTIWSWKQKERYTGNGMKSLKCWSPCLVTHLLQQAHTPNPSQTCTPTETKSSNMKPVGTILLKTATRNIPLCIFPFNHIPNFSFFLVFLKFCFACSPVNHFLFSSQLPYFLSCIIFPSHLFFSLLSKLFSVISWSFHFFLHFLKDFCSNDYLLNLGKSHSFLLHLHHSGSDVLWLCSDRQRVSA